MSKSVEKQENISETEEVDPENVLHREREKEKLNDKSWTSAILEDVKLFKSYEFRKVESRSASDKYHSIETYTSSENPKEVFENLKNQDSERFSKDEWKEDSSFTSDGTFKFNGRKYEYKKKLIPVAFVSRSPDTEYAKRIKLDKISKSPVQIYESLTDKVGHRVLVGRTMTGDTLLSTRTEGIEGEKVTFTKRSKIIGGGMLSTFGLATILTTFATPILGVFSLSMVAFSTLTILMGLSVYYGYKKTDYLHSGNDGTWLYNIPDDAAIRRLKHDGGVQEQFDVKETEIHSYSDGSIVIESDEAKWTFDSKTDGTPSPRAVELIDDLAVGTGDNTKEFAIAEKDEFIESGGLSYYESDDGEKVLTRKSEYRG